MTSVGTFVSPYCSASSNVETTIWKRQMQSLLGVLVQRLTGATEPVDSRSLTDAGLQHRAALQTPPMPLQSRQAISHKDCRATHQNSADRYTGA